MNRCCRADSVFSIFNFYLFILQANPVSVRFFLSLRNDCNVFRNQKIIFYATCRPLSTAHTKYGYCRHQAGKDYHLCLCAYPFKVTTQFTANLSRWAQLRILCKYAERKSKEGQGKVLRRLIQDNKGGKICFLSERSCTHSARFLVI